MKTAVTALQEMMVKLKEIPEYECISQSGPQHLATFEYRCSARGCVVNATARSKKEAKQEVARIMLLALKARGEDVPPPFDRPSLQPPPGVAEPAPAPSSGPGPRSYVALLKELCEEYHLPGVEYELISDTGPPHMRQFAVRASLGQHSRLATSTTKKAARQLAAQQLYSYMRDNLSRLTTDFVEEDMLMRAHERVMERYVEATREDTVWRPDLGQRVADYHLGIVAHVDAEKCKVAQKIVDGWYREGCCEDSAENAVEAASAALGLAADWTALDTEDSGAPLAVLELGPISPALALAGRSRAEAATAAMQFLCLSLRYPPPPRGPAAAPAADPDADSDADLVDPA